MGREGRYVRECRSGSSNFEEAIQPIDYCKSESQIAIELLATIEDRQPSQFNAAATRQAMGAHAALDRFVSGVSLPKLPMAIESDMNFVEL